MEEKWIFFTSRDERPSVQKYLSQFNTDNNVTYSTKRSCQKALRIVGSASHLSSQPFTELEDLDFPGITYLQTPGPL